MKCTITLIETLRSSCVVDRLWQGSILYKWARVATLWWKHPCMIGLGWHHSWVVGLGRHNPRVVCLGRHDPRVVSLGRHNRWVICLGRHHPLLHHVAGVVRLWWWHHAGLRPHHVTLLPCHVALRWHHVALGHVVVVDVAVVARQIK